MRSEGIKENSKAIKNLEIKGIKVHNLKNVDVEIPLNKLVVFTGLSGSGKSSLAFDTIYAEGQRRYLETFSAYSRQYIGSMERPDIDSIRGLSPVIAIEQKTTHKNPRSTVGTITEIYDFIRLLYSRIADAYSPTTGNKLVKYTSSQIIDLISETYFNKNIKILAPIVTGRKGHYREQLEQARRKGYLKARIDGEIVDLKQGMQLDRYVTHNIEIEIDNLTVSEQTERRLARSINTALEMGNNSILIIETDTNKAQFYSLNLIDTESGLSYQNPEPNLFSFNTPYGYCPNCKGIGYIVDVDIKKVIPDDELSIRNGGISPIGKYKNSWIFKQIELILGKYNLSIDKKIKQIPPEIIDKILFGTDEIIKEHNAYLGITSSYQLNFKGIAYYINNQVEETTSLKMKSWAEKFTNTIKCPACNGTRLKPDSLLFKINDKNISEISEMDVLTLRDWFADLRNNLSEKKLLIANEIIGEIEKRIQFLLDLGIDYLTLNRPAHSLSGGETQRIRLASQIGSKLIGVMYILDEPSIGLHQRDNIKLINSLKQLRDAGNSVIVVEHDEEMMRAADFILDIGPGGGTHGGKIVAKGTISDIENSNSITGKYLKGTEEIPVPKTRRKIGDEKIVLKGASGNNLKDITLTLPLGVFICVTGVSGSGKSTLINDTLHPILSKALYRSTRQPLPYKSIEGVNNINKVIKVDQSPIGRTPRSNLATYTGVFDDIRKLYAETPEAKIRGYKPGRFSFNVRGGRCETCSGAGVKTIEMNFLPDVHVNCETCNGKRYNKQTLEIRYKGKSINDVLNMTVEDACSFFENIPHIYSRIKVINDVGLGYVTLGQPSTTISGGEAQRIKLATELSKKDTGNTLYLLDEPTTGLHFADIKILLNVLQKLVDKGNTVVVIEHNLDVVKIADYIIDMGPEGGNNGGTITAQGTPEEIIKVKNNYTAKYLKPYIVK
ncbi:MAG: excinuclease ABC subunit UvrA [Bacteroidales bacterium]